MSTWSYDGAATVSVTFTVDDADQASFIELAVDEPNASLAQLAGLVVGSTHTLTAAPGVSGLSPGDLFVANLNYTDSTFFESDFGTYSQRKTKEARLFVYGTAGSGVAYAPSYTFSGTTFQVAVLLDAMVANGSASPFYGAELDVFCSDCNSSAFFSGGSPGAQGTLYTVTISNVGHCDASPLVVGESFHVGLKSGAQFFYDFHVSVVAGLTADFSGTPTSGAAPLTVTFSDLSFGGTPTSWLWDFGDGDTSTDQNPVHTYLTPGVYTVSLTVDDGASTDTKTRIDYITVGDYVLLYLATKSGFRAA